MGWVGLRGISVKAKTGYYPQERALGVDLLIDVRVKLSLKEVSSTDELQFSYNYENIAIAVEQAATEEFMLLETFARRVVELMLQYRKSVEVIEIKVNKLNPPVNLPVNSSEVVFVWPEDFR